AIRSDRRVVRDHTRAMPAEVNLAADRAAIELGRELQPGRRVGDACDDLPRIVEGLRVWRDYTSELTRVVARLSCNAVGQRCLDAREAPDDVACDPNPVRIGLGEKLTGARDARVHFSAAECLGLCDLARCS